jgi:hypothetical protein
MSTRLSLPIALKADLMSWRKPGCRIQKEIFDEQNIPFFFDVETP